MARVVQLLLADALTKHQAFTDACSPPSPLPNTALR